MITYKQINKVLGLSVPENIEFHALGLVDSKQFGTLTFCNDKRFIRTVNSNPNITGVFIKDDMKQDIIDTKTVIAVDDPYWSFFTLANYIGELNYTQSPSIVDPSAQIHETAHVSDFNVKIGKNVTVGPNVTIMPDVEIHDNCMIQANTVLGCDDVEAKMTSKGLIYVFHDAKLVINENVRVGANTTIVKGLYGRDTVIGPNSFISADCHISHSVQIGEQCLILNCSINGSVIIGNRVRINPGAVISNQIHIGDNAYITLGAVVIRDIEPHDKVSGNFAINHNRYLYKFIKNFGPIESSA